MSTSTHHLYQDWSPPEEWLKIKCIDMHTGGEPLRIIGEGLPELKGKNILDMRRYFRDNLDYIRRLLMWEPRGHADMYGAVITPPVEAGSDFGTFFLHNEGYSTMCGHAIIALSKFAVETGLLTKKEDEEIIIDAPPGKIYSKVHRKDGKVDRVSFKNVPSFVLMKDKSIQLENYGEVRFDIAFGGAFYAFVDAEKLGVSLEKENAQALIELGRDIKLEVMKNYEIKHPFEEDLSFLYGTIFTAKPHKADHHSRNVCIFANGELDRSSTGSGVSARAAIHYDRGEISKGESIRIESIIDTTMDVKVHEECSFGPHKALVPEVSGTAHFTARNEFLVDPDDPLKKGFIFR